MQGSLDVISGCMFAGKTQSLIRLARMQQELGRSIGLFKPSIDNRYSTESIVSHDGQMLPARLMDLSLSGLPKNYDEYFIDEIQFFNGDAIATIMDFVYAGKRVVVSGLDLDWQGKPFPTMATLLCLATSVTKVYAKCVKCGGIATRTYRISDEDDDILIGGADKYEARRLTCFGVP